MKTDRITVWKTDQSEKAYTVRLPVEHGEVDYVADNEVVVLRLSRSRADALYEALRMHFAEMV